MQRSSYIKWWDDQTISSLALTKSDEFSQQVMMERVRTLLSEADVDAQLASNADILSMAMQVFDRTFAITHVLRLLAVLVAFVGVLCALMALQLERMKEFAILRATGATQLQVRCIILIQTVMIGLLSGLLSIPMGLMMADILIDVINRRAFGWSMQHFVPPAVLGEALVLAIFAAFVAGIYPAQKAAKISAAEALREG